MLGLEPVHPLSHKGKTEKPSSHCWFRTSKGWPSHLQRLKECMFFMGLTNLRKFKIKGLPSSRTLQRCLPLMVGAAVCGVQAEGQTLQGEEKSSERSRRTLTLAGFLLPRSPESGPGAKGWQQGGGSDGPGSCSPAVAAARRAALSLPPPCGASRGAPGCWPPCCGHHGSPGRGSPPNHLNTRFPLLSKPSR